LSKSDTNPDTSEEINSDPIVPPSNVLSSPRVKATIRVKDMLSIDPSRLIYPRGIVTKVRECDRESPPLRRIELFAKDDKDTYGIIRDMFVAFSSEKKLLEIAEASNGVIQVTTMQSQAARHSGHSGRGQILRDKLILKRIEREEDEEVQQASGRNNNVEDQLAAFLFRRIKVPALHVPARWRERMELKPGDRLIVSNPIETYEVPPPNI
jgi:hypothetical protein